MAPSHVITVIALMARIYSVNPAVIQCTIFYESAFNVEAQNGEHVGVAQFHPRTFHWMLDMASSDPQFRHMHLFGVPTPSDPLQAIALMTWAFRNGYQDHWCAYRLCHEIRVD